MEKKRSLCRGQVHVVRNVLAKVPRRQKDKVADDIRSIFYASSRNKAIELYGQFVDKWENDIALSGFLPGKVTHLLSDVFPIP